MLAGGVEHGQRAGLDQFVHGEGTSRPVIPPSPCVDEGVRVVVGDRGDAENGDGNGPMDTRLLVCGTTGRGSLRV